MKNKLRNVKISICLIALFALLLLLVDITAPFWIGEYVSRRGMKPEIEIYMLITIYAGSVIGWYCLYCLCRLFINIGAGEYFTTENSRLMKKISLMCVGVSAVALISAIYYAPFGIVGAAALLMSLIVNAVKDAFVKAQKMKDELELTI